MKNKYIINVVVIIGVVIIKFASLGHFVPSGLRNDWYEVSRKIKIMSCEEEEFQAFPLRDATTNRSQLESAVCSLNHNSITAC